MMKMDTMSLRIVMIIPEFCTEKQEMIVKPSGNPVNKGDC